MFQIVKLYYLIALCKESLIAESWSISPVQVHVTMICQCMPCHFPASKWPKRAYHSVHYSVPVLPVPAY